jgi:hypothetical protein
MHAVIVRVTINDAEKATERLRSDVVPRVKEAPGFVAGYWVRLEGGDQGRGMIAFESEDAARAAVEAIRATPREGEVTIDSIEVAEVVESA